MRDQAGRGADAIGVRDHVKRARDLLVDALNGTHASAGVRQNRKDDDHLRLLLRFGLRSTSSFLDIGANQGLFLRGIEEVAPLGHHIAYEPLPHICARLAQRFPRIEIRQRALSDAEGEAQFLHVMEPGLQGFSSLVEGGLGDSASSYPVGAQTETITVTTERLDNHRPDGWLPDYVKIDVEGAEALVLRGAIETFRLAKPVIAFEHMWHKDTTEEVYSLICNDIGLRIFDMDGTGPLNRSQFDEELVTRWNWVAHE
jgi:FkbM family methyltransferase